MKFTIIILALAVLPGCSQTSGSGESGRSEISSQNYKSKALPVSQTGGNHQYLRTGNDKTGNRTLKIKLVQGSPFGKWKHNIVYSVIF